MSVDIFETIIGPCQNKTYAHTKKFGQTVILTPEFLLEAP